ncbi:BON domain-containing protein [Gammaproteobacteria bacterium]|nr:BON domain-containing protein [Gammaproteobacteria bacterium]
MKKIALSCMLAIGLHGCAAVIIGAAATASAIVYDHRSLKTIYQDQKVAHQAYQQLDKNPQLKGCMFSVSSINRSVLLLGQVKTSEQRLLAEKITRQVPLVKRIYNQIEIVKKISVWESTKDSFITTKVKTEMLGQKGLRSAQIKVVTADSNVYLMGLVNAQQASLAAQTAKKVSGVHKVVKLFEIGK